MKKVIIAGSRDFSDYELLKRICMRILAELAGADEVTIISGHARGADRLGERFAREHHLPCDSCPADWKRYGKAAGPIRNAEMAKMADVLIAFWDGESAGTRSMIDLARSYGLAVYVIKISPGI